MRKSDVDEINKIIFSDSIAVRRASKFFKIAAALIIKCSPVKTLESIILSAVW